MLAKYFITGAITAVLAGGAVFMVADAAELHPHDRVEKRADKDMAKATPAKAKVDDMAADTDPSTSKSMIQRMLSKDTGGDDSPARRYDAGTKAMDAAKDNDPAERMDAGRIETMKSQPRKMDGDSKDGDRKVWLDQYLGSDSKADAKADKEARGASHMMSKTSRDEDPRTTTREDVSRWLGPDEGKMSKAENRVDRMDTKVERGSDTAKGTFVIAPEGRETADTDDTEDAPRTGGIRSISELLDVVKEGERDMYAILLDEAEKLEIEDVRNGAYLNIIDFALMRGDYERARALTGELSTEELRDTARQNMGMALARAGRMEEAFAVVDTLEIEELADPIRLAIIQAATDRSSYLGMEADVLSMMQR